MREITNATSELREALHYVARFRKSTFVIAIDGRVLEGNDILSVAEDIFLLHTIGIRIVVAVGCSDQTDYSKRMKSRYARLHSLAEQLCQHIDTYQFASFPSLVCDNAKPQNFAFKISEKDTETELLPDKIRDVLAKSLIPVIVAKPKNGGADKSWFESLLRVVSIICGTILTDKLIYLSCFDGVFKEDKTLLREAEPREIRQMIIEGTITGQFAEFMETAEKVIHSGVTRVHVINGKVYGSLLKETFTKDGVGTMIHQNPYQETRKARPSDINGILNVLGTQGSHTDVRRHLEEVIGSQLATYRVAVKDDEVTACGCIRSFAEERKALISSLAVANSYLSKGVGELLLASLFKEAKEQGVTLLTLISPNTGQWWLSREFTKGKISDLPTELQTGNSSPSTVILVKRLDT